MLLIISYFNLIKKNKPAPKQIKKPVTSKMRQIFLLITDSNLVYILMAKTQLLL